MDVSDLKLLLESSNDKFGIFEDKEVLNRYDLSYYDLTSLIIDFLSDEEKAKLFDLEHFKKLAKSLKMNIIKSISNDRVKLGLLGNNELMEQFEKYEIVDLIMSLGENGKITILYTVEFIEKYEIKDYKIKEIIESLSDEKKYDVLINSEISKKIEEFYIEDIVKSMKSDEDKRKLIERLNFKSYTIASILTTFSEEKRIEMLPENKYDFSRSDITKILSSLEVDTLVNFLRDNKDFFVQNNIKIYDVIGRLDKESQMKFVYKFEDAGLSLGEKRQILAKLSPDAKRNIDISSFPEEYKTAIEIQISKETMKYGNIIVDYTGDMERYRDLDELILINALNIGMKEKDKLFELGSVCPKLHIQDDLGMGYSTAEDYKNGEAWIDSVLQSIPSDWTDVQKIAFVDNAIGKKISYSPDFDTEIFNGGDSRALWKIINKGEGVCNGISQVGKYILGKLGIESEMVSSGRHAFLRLKDIEFTTADGENKRGDTILDSTWNLSAERYGAIPNNFCRNYEEIRKHDIRPDGTDQGSHKNDGLSDVTLDVDEKTLRQIFISIGLADKEGNFPIKKLLDESKVICASNISEEKKIKEQFVLLKDYYPGFAECINETSSILTTLLGPSNLKHNKCVVKRVFEREDKEKRPVLYVYVDLPEEGKKFYFADKSTGQFIELSQKEFEERFACYEKDLEKDDGRAPWAEGEKTNNSYRPAKDYSEVAAREGEDR